MFCSNLVNKENIYNFSATAQDPVGNLAEQLSLNMERTRPDRLRSLPQCRAASSVPKWPAFKIYCRELKI